jgi:acetyltransferase-like isoleucine patch superfamily enzyme
MNLHFLVRRLLGKPTCVRAKQVQIRSTARIINIGGDSGLISLGRGTVIDGQLLTFAHGGRIRVGEWCFVGEGSRIWSAADIKIGDRVLISHNVNIFDNLTHPLDPVARHEHFRTIATAGHPRDLDLGERPIRIEDDAWISAGATVLRGVTVGRGAIVGAGAVVTSDVPPMCVVGGNPARIIRHLEAAPKV